MGITVSNTLALRDRTSSVMDRISSSTRRMSDALRNMGDNADGAQGRMNKLGESFVQLNQGLELVKKAFEFGKNLTEIIDEWGTIRNRLKSVIKPGEDVEKVLNQIKAAAHDSGAGFTDMAGAITSMASNAANKFGSTQEIIDFTKALNQAVYLGPSGGKGSALEETLFQVSQAMGSGIVQAEEFNTVLDNAPKIARALEKQLGFTGKDALKDLKDALADGAVDAAYLKNAVLNNANDIQLMFSATGTTFKKEFTDMKNQIMYQFIPAFEKGFEKVLKFLNSPAWAEWKQNIVTATAVVIKGLYILLGAAKSIYDFLEENSYLIKGVFVAIGIAAVSAAVSTIIAWTAANAELLLTAAAIAAVIGILDVFGISSTDVIGGVIGIVYVLIGAISDIGLAWDQMKLMFWQVSEAIYKGIQGIMNWITEMINATVKGVLVAVNTIIDAANKIPGVSMDKVNTNAGLAMPPDLVGPASAGVAAAKKRLEGRSYTDAATQFNKGQDKVSSVFANLGTAFDDLKNSLDPNKTKGDTNRDYLKNIDKVNSVGKIDKDVKISDQDLKYLNDVSKMKYINKFTTLRPSVKASFGDVRETADVKKLMTAIEGMVADSLATALL